MILIYTLESAPSEAERKYASVSGGRFVNSRHFRQTELETGATLVVSDRKDIRDAYKAAGVDTEPLTRRKSRPRKTGS